MPRRRIGMSRLASARASLRQLQLLLQGNTRYSLGTARRRGATQNTIPSVSSITTTTTITARPPRPRPAPATMASPVAALLWRSLRVFQVFGANTDVGKTVFTTLLARTAARRWADERVAFLKPVSTGAAADADDQCEPPRARRRRCLQRL